MIQTAGERTLACTANNTMPSKRYKKALAMVDLKKSYALEEAIDLLKKFPKVKFDETIEVAFKLGVDPKH